MSDLDRIDRKILDILQRDGRLSMTELAQRIGLSTSPCAERVRRMERSGVSEPRVLECHLVSGSLDYLIQARLTAMSEYRDLLGQILRKVPVPAQSNSYVVMEEIKDVLALPVDLGATA